MVVDQQYTRFSMKDKGYDFTKQESIYAFAKKLIGHTFQDVLDHKVDAFYEGINEDRELPDFGNQSRKGGLGNLLEEEYFGYKSNSISKADFAEAGVELKASPYEINKKGKYRAGERLVLTMISYTEPVEEDFEKSHLWKKCEHLLLIYYRRDRALEDRLLYGIDYVYLFTPNETDRAIIKKDYQYIIDKIAAGKANELSESDTMYLGASTKGENAEKSTVPQTYYAPTVVARKRSFCYKGSYMTFVLNEYILKNWNALDSIVQDAKQLENKTFEQVITEKIEKYIGKTDKELCGSFDREYNNNKAQWTDLVYRMLGIKNNRAAEFKKANIVVKVIRLEENGKMKESMSFPPFVYKELVQEEWEDSTLRNYFDETKLFFVVFKRQGDNYVLRGSQLWNMPHNDLDEIVKEGWNSVVDTIKKGIQFNIKKNGSGVVVENDLPKKSDNEIIHVRPHATKRFYEFPDGRTIGDAKDRIYSNQLEDGTWMPNYSFWINNSYILKHLNVK